MKFLFYYSDLDYSPTWYSSLLEFIQSDIIQYGIEWDEEEETKHKIIPQMIDALDGMGRSWSLYRCEDGGEYDFYSVTKEQLKKIIEDNKERLIREFEY